MLPDAGAAPLPRAHRIGSRVSETEMCHRLRDPAPYRLLNRGIEFTQLMARLLVQLCEAIITGDLGTLKFCVDVRGAWDNLLLRNFG